MFDSEMVDCVQLVDGRSSLCLGTVQTWILQSEGIINGGVIWVWG